MSPVSRSCSWLTHGHPGEGTYDNRHQTALWASTSVDHQSNAQAGPQPKLLHVCTLNSKQVQPVPLDLLCLLLL
jgi:hypothetical protein